MIDFLNESLYLGDDVEDYDNRNKAKGSVTFRSFIMTEAADEAYNQRITNKICTEIRDIMGDIYIASPSGTRSANKIRLIRKGGGGAYQFELKINSDGTISVNDNSQARGFIKTLKDGSKKFILLNANEFYRTSRTNDAGVNELVEWLTDNYDKYEPANAAARDRRNGITTAARTSAAIPVRRSSGPRRTTEISRRHGITSVADFLRNGGNIRDLI